MKPDSPHSPERSLSTLRLFTRDRSTPSDHYLPLTDTHVMEIPAGSNLNAMVNAMSQDPAVDTVEIDQQIHAHLSPNDSLLNLQWPIVKSAPNIGAETAWGFIHNTQNILIAIIDSGADLNHPDVHDNLWTNTGEIPGNGIDDDGDGLVDDVNGYDFFNQKSSPDDDFGHGTMVYGEIGACGDNAQGITGVAWNAQIMVLKVLDSNGNSNISTAVEAIEFAIKKGVKIINMSWGYTPNGTPSLTLEAALQKAKDAGILVITSAGNGDPTGRGIDNDANQNEANYPSSYPEDNIIAVAATDSNDNLASFSNYGSTTVDLGAPGVAIYSTSLNNSYDYFTGTSAAAPYVTGSAALLWAANPSIGYADIKRLLLETTDPIPSLQGKTLTGGRLNVGRALQNSPAQGGNLLEGASPLPEANIAPQGNSGSSGGCSLSQTAQGYFSCWMWGANLIALVLLKRRKPLKKRALLS
jgi:subtilisin family serine protease